ncbi:MAG: flavodoxin family protein [Bacteroidaceae bacterium]|nr:flavodoxin family protein [Bacteroidaceae bacterium]
MNILVLSGSPRKKGNTDLLVEAFVKGASQKHSVEIISVHDYKVNPCVGCDACFKSESHTCAQKDDMSVVYDKMSHADMLVIASPVYFYGLSAPLKAVIDRFHNPVRDTYHIKKLALLLVGAASLPELFDGILAQYQLCLNFFKLEDAGHVLIRRAHDKGDVKNSNALNEAFEFGKSISSCS